MSTTTDLTTLKINYLTQAQYDTAKENNQINENEIYMTPMTDMTSQEVEDFVDELNIQEVVVADYVVEQGTSGDWAYRKWNSGKVEAWAHITFDSASWTVWASPVRYMDKTVTIPSGIFNSGPRIIAGSGNNQYWVVNCAASSATSFGMRLATVASSAMATTVRVYAWTD